MIHLCFRKFYFKITSEIKIQFEVWIGTFLLGFQVRNLFLSGPASIFGICHRCLKWNISDFIWYLDLNFGKVILKWLFSLNIRLRLDLGRRFSSVKGYERIESWRSSKHTTSSLLKCMIIVNCLKNTIQISIFLHVRFVFPEDCNNVTFKINDLSCAEKHKQLMKISKEKLCTYIW